MGSPETTKPGEATSKSDPGAQAFAMIVSCLTRLDNPSSEMSHD